MYSQILKSILLLLLFPTLLLSQTTENKSRLFSKDGAWCWFSDPRAVYHKGEHQRTYVGSVSSFGDIKIGYYDHNDNSISEETVYPAFQADDHVNPSLLILPDGRIMIFFTGHNGGFYYSRTKNPEDIKEWEEVRKMDLGNRLCYTNPVMLEEEDNRIYVFSRSGHDWKPSYIFSDDMGDTWSEPESFVAKPNSSINNRPYTKVISDGKSRIWFAITDGHPRDKPLNSIYVFYYEDDQFFQTTGEPIGGKEDIPLDQTKIHKAYDAEETLVRSWIWDLALNEKGHPIIAYTQLKEETRHRYFYAKWDGNEWQHSFVAEGGKDFPREERLKEERNPEPHYSGGITIDHQQTDVIYFSRPEDDIFEIFKARKKNDKWKEIPITQDSEFDNVRPFVVRNRSPKNKAGVLWMLNVSYKHYTNYMSRIFLKAPAK